MYFVYTGEIFGWKNVIFYALHHSVSAIYVSSTDRWRYNEELDVIEEFATDVTSGWLDELFIQSGLEGWSQGTSKVITELTKDQVIYRLDPME